MRNLLGALLVLAAVPAFADMSGKWSGDLSYQATGEQTESETCDVSIVDTADSITVSDPDTCFYFSEDDNVFQKVGGVLSYNGAEIGSITDSTVTLHSDDGSFKWDMNITVNTDGTLALDESAVDYSDPSSPYTEITSGTMSPASTLHPLASAVVAKKFLHRRH